MTAVTVLATPRCDLGEGPTWEPSTQTLSWVDLHAGVLHRRGPDGIVSYQFDPPLSAALPTPTGTLLVQGARIGLLADLADATTLRPLATVPLGMAARCNDAQLDRWGRVWVGTMAPDQPGAAALYFLDPGSPSPTLACDGLTLANGIGWSPRHDRIYLIDTGTRTVLSAALDGAGRPAGHFAPLLDLGDAPGVPDGLCVDVAGGIWIAMFGGAQLRCYDPSGPLREVVQLPLRYPTSVVFVGPDLDELVVTTARATPTVADDADAAGQLLSIRPRLLG
jgi:sugar lactone lactonase YvrE